MDNRNMWSVEAEQSLLGGLLRDSDAYDRIAHIEPAHFYVGDNQIVFTEMQRQIGAGRRVDAVTLAEVLKDRVPDVFAYLVSLSANSGGAANIEQYARIVLDHARRRALQSAGQELQEAVRNPSQDATAICDAFAARLDEIVQKQQGIEPVRISDSMVRYADLIQRRMDGLIKPVPTGFRDLDAQLGGGLERGSVTVAAGRPGTGKTAFGLSIARNVAVTGVTLFLSMEMSEHAVNDRNVAALGQIPLSWLRQPIPSDTATWERMTGAFIKARDMRLYVDDTTALNMLAIRSKARQIKRKHGLDLLVLDQLSFIQAMKKYDNPSYAIGEITRSLVALAKELDCAVLLLAQLNRECEKRMDKRPIMADLAVSGSIEQDAANIIFLYRDELYKPDSQDKGVAEVNVVKQRQGCPGVVGLSYQSEYTNFTDLPYRWTPRRAEVTRPTGRSSRGGLG